MAIAADNPNTNVNVALGANATKQLQATGHYSDNTTADLSSIANWSSSQTSVASVSSNSGLVASNTAAGQTTISATTDGVTGQMTVSVVPFAYVTDYYFAGGSTYYCAFASNIITSCTSTTNSPYHPWGLGVDPTAPNLYISDTGDGTVSGMKIYRCPISNTGAISAACTDVGYQNILNGQTPVYIAINPTGTIAYLTNANGTTAPVVGYCKINASTGSFENCASLCNSSYCGSNGIVISPDNKWAYISGITYGKPSIHACPITSSGAFGTCLYAYSGATTNQLYGLAINETGTMLYATEILGANTISIYKCIISSPGHISSCTTSVQDISASPISAVALNPTASYVYTVGNAFSSSTSFCSALVPTGTPASCTRPSSPTSFNQLRGIGIF